MKRCTLFLSTAGGSSPYGTFTNITTDQTSGVWRQIWHTYLNEQQGSSGSRRQAVCRSLHGSWSTAPLLSKDTLYICHSFHFCQGKKLICPRSTKSEKKVFFFSLRNKCTWQVGILSFGFVKHKYIAGTCKAEKCRRTPDSECGWGSPINISIPLKITYR